VEDLDGQILAALAEDLLVLLLDYLSGAVVRVDDIVTDREVNALRLSLELEVLDLLDGCLGNGGPPCYGSGCRIGLRFRSGDSDPRG
jgi:hypothetical protein